MLDGMAKEGYSSNIIPVKFIRSTLALSPFYSELMQSPFRKLFSCHFRFILFFLTTTLLLSVLFSALAKKTPKIELIMEELDWLNAQRKIVVGVEMN